MVILSPGQLKGLMVNLILKQAIAVTNLAHVVHRQLKQTNKEPLQNRVWEALECCKQKQKLLIMVETGKIRNLKEIWAVTLWSAVVIEDCVVEMNQQPCLVNPNDLAPFSLSSENPKEGEFKMLCIWVTEEIPLWLLAPFSAVYNQKSEQETQ